MAGREPPLVAGTRSQLMPENEPEPGRKAHAFGVDGLRSATTVSRTEHRPVPPSAAAPGRKLDLDRSRHRRVCLGDF
jgi:hypothetical protein